jgi:hypothetical protein
MIIRLPQDLVIDTVKPPEDLEEIVTENFCRYTEGTRKEYRYQDKLSYIDLMRKRVWNWEDPHDKVLQLILDRQRTEIDDTGKIPDTSEFYCMEFMEECFREGFMPLYGRYTGIEHEDERTMMVMLRIIKAVVEYEG